MIDIKFRAWVNHDSQPVMITEENDSDFMMISNGNGFGIVYDHEEWIDEKDFSIMQYTGLKDKNGVEIYEGDIVATKNSKYKVVFDKCCFWGIDEMGKYPIYQISHYIMDDERFEVIGNIHENSELLK